MAISIRKPSEILKIEKASVLVADTLAYLKTTAKAGISLLELNSIGENFILKNGGKPSFKGLYGFPAGIITSVNEVIIHGIPTNYLLKQGDIVGFDVGVEIDGWYGDAAITIGIGEISKEDQSLIECAKDALDFSIAQIYEGMRFKELSQLIEKFILLRGYVPLKGYCGHGIGKKPHEEPEIPNYLDSKTAQAGPKIKNGMVFCIEPMICQFNSLSKILDDKWSVVSLDGKNGSHYEHTIAIVDGKAKILSNPSVK